jgi:hypothetical protein
VPKRGLEPPLPCENVDLNHARLPIPPFRLTLEVIVQTSYLLGMAELKAPADEWLKMLDSGVTKALEQNLALRDFIKKNSQP